jgi:hypothetical protein
MAMKKPAAKQILGMLVGLGTITGYTPGALAPDPPSTPTRSVFGLLNGEVLRIVPRK